MTLQRAGWKAFVLILMGRLLIASPFTDFDAAHSQGLDATITEGLLISAQSTQRAHLYEIRSQLGFLVGLLNGRTGLADLGHAQITITSADQNLQTQLYTVKYRATFLVAWPYGVGYPAKFSVQLPRQINDASRTQFYKAYAPRCSVDPADPAMNPYSYYYYYRPEKSGCPLLKKISKENPLTSQMTIALTPSSAATANHSPEYEKVWEDKRFAATIIFGTYENNPKPQSDYGIAAFNNMYISLRRQLGTPAWMNKPLAANAYPGLENPDVEMHFNNGNGRTIDIALFLVPGMVLTQAPAWFADRYNQRSEFSDFISYNGHSAYGANIKTLTNLGHFVTGQYQLFYINGCDTFAYVDDSLMNAHQAANPFHDPYKFFDIITNSMPSPFGEFARTNLTVLSAFFQAKGTYRQILSGFNPAQRAVVMGEQDNGKPY